MKTLVCLLFVLVLTQCDILDTLNLQSKVSPEEQYGITWEDMNFVKGEQLPLVMFFMHESKEEEEFMQYDYLEDRYPETFCWQRDENGKRVQLCEALPVSWRMFTSPESDEIDRDLIRKIAKQVSGAVFKGGSGPDSDKGDNFLQPMYNNFFEIFGEEDVPVLCICYSFVKILRYYSELVENQPSSTCKYTNKRTRSSTKDLFYLDIPDTASGYVYDTLKSVELTSPVPLPDSDDSDSSASYNLQALPEGFKTGFEFTQADYEQFKRDIIGPNNLGVPFTAVSTCCMMCKRMFDWCKLGEYLEITSTITIESDDRIMSSSTDQERCRDTPFYGSDSDDAIEDITFVTSVRVKGKKQFGLQYHPEITWDDKVSSSIRDEWKLRKEKLQRFYAQEFHNYVQQRNKPYSRAVYTLLRLHEGRSVDSEFKVRADFLVDLTRIAFNSQK